MMAHEMLNFHPLANTGTTTIAREGLLKFLEATGHKPRIEAGIRPQRLETAIAFARILPI